MFLSDVALFHTYVVSVYSKMFHPFHTDVAFKCFMLFEESRDTGRAARRCPTDGARWVLPVGA
jgi:hypothetical protein